MKNLLFLVFFPIISIAQLQTDSIFKKDGSIIVCTITKVDPEYIQFDVDKLKDRYIRQENISRFKVHSSNTNIKYTDSPASAKPQNVSTDTVFISKELNFMRMCLQKHNSEHSIGLGILGGGYLITTIGTGAYLYADTSQGLEASRAMIIAGSTIILTGIVVLIDSQKWIRKAGLGIGGNGMGVVYKFK